MYHFTEIAAELEMNYMQSKQEQLTDTQNCIIRALLLSLPSLFDSVDGSVLRNPTFSAN